MFISFSTANLVMPGMNFLPGRLVFVKQSPINLLKPIAGIFLYYFSKYSECSVILTPKLILGLSLSELIEWQLLQAPKGKLCEKENRSFASCEPYVQEQIMWKKQLTLENFLNNLQWLKGEFFCRHKAHLASFKILVENLYQILMPLQAKKLSTIRIGCI